MDKELEIAKRVAKQAGEIILGYYGRDFQVAEKDNNTSVTEADTVSEDFIKTELSRVFSYPILSEESVDDSSRLDSDLVWIVDPLDGTRDFIAGTGEFTVVIALVQNHQPVVGVVYQPTTKTLYYAQKGGGAFVESAEGISLIRVSTEADLNKAKFVVSRLGPKNAERMDQLGFLDRERIGSLALKVCLVAAGKYDVYFAFKTETSEWDTCAPDLILSEAGGKTTDVMGESLLYNQADVLRHRGFING